jgi:hypothetical protein
VRWRISPGLPKERSVILRWRQTLMAAVLAGLAAIIYFALVVPYRERLAASRHARWIGVPTEQIAYRGLTPIAVRSDEDWRAYLANLKFTDIVFKIFEEDRNWDRWPAFEDAVRTANVSYPSEVLVIVPYTRGSSSVEHTVGPLRLTSRKLWFNISRSKPTVRTADMNYGCFAIAVKKSEIDQVEMRVDGVPRTVVQLN